MNDTELDELLDRWKTPPPPATMREYVRAGIVTKPKTAWRNLFRGWRLVFVSMVVVLLAILIDTSAFSEKTSPPPYTVDSEVTLHGNGSTWGCVDLGGRCWSYTRPAHSLMTSYNQSGSEVLLSWSAPDAPMDAMYLEAIMTVGEVIEKFKRRFVLDPDPEADAHASLYWGIDERFVLGERAPLMNSGCKPPGRTGEVMGQDVVLGYATIVGQFGGYKSRVTLWMAPELSCFALRAKAEREQDDGSWILTSEKNALKVTVSH